MDTSSLITRKVEYARILEEVLGFTMPEGVIIRHRQIEELILKLQVEKERHIKHPSVWNKSVPVFLKHAAKSPFSKNLHLRASRILVNSQIYFVGQLVSRKQRDVQLLPGMGPQTFKVIATALNEHQLAFGTYTGDWKPPMHR